MVLNEIEEKELRINWIDKLKGFTIFLVVYGHNFPLVEKYIYSFHMPLFIFLAGMFHPLKMNFQIILHRTKKILIPYFLWGLLLYLIWFFLGRNYGESARLNLSPIKNLIGVFYSQGGREYMDWGIPMWFLPFIFIVFIFFGFIEKLEGAKKQILFILLIIIGFMLSAFLKYKYIWSLDVAFVSVFFYGIGFYCKNYIIRISNIWFLGIGVLHFIFFNFNIKIDMYRSIYGNIPLFLVNAVLGIFFYIELFKRLPRINVLNFLGRNTIVILATQIRTLTFIKLILLVLFGTSVFVFNELEKFFISILQLIIISLIIKIINKYFPLLNGK